MKLTGLTTGGKGLSVEKTTGNSKNGPYDLHFFQEWQDQLQRRLQVTLPTVFTNDQNADETEKGFESTFLSACTSVREAKAAVKDTESILSTLQKVQPDNIPKEVIDAIHKAVEQGNTALSATQKTCQLVVTPWLTPSTTRTAPRSVPSVCSLPEFLSPTFDDTALVQWTALHQAGGPKALADWCAQKSTTSAQRLVKLLQSPAIVRTWQANGGPKQGAYGRASEIYFELQHANGPSDVTLLGCRDPRHAVLERLKLAIALELCAPLDVYPSNPTGHVDTVQRYIFYEQSFLMGELDPAFANFTVWELRMAIASDATEEELGWGRQCLRNFRPDIVLPPVSTAPHYHDSRFRYSYIVRTDVTYKAPIQKDGKLTYPEILDGGGKCGPRAWFGRFICNAFGIPTWGVQQPGHAALSRWTPDQGWVTCLGAGFNHSFWKGRTGLDFLLETQARSALNDDGSLYYRLVGRLEMLALFRKEHNKSLRSQCMVDPKNPIYSLSLLQRRILRDQRGKIRSTCTDETKVESKDSHRHNYYLSQPLNTRHFLSAGNIVIPTSSCSKPEKSTRNVIFSPSFLGGTQVCIHADAKVKYTIPSSMLPDASVPHTYKLTCHICTVHRDEPPMLLTISSKNGRKEDTISCAQIKVPYTMGMWTDTQPVEVKLGGSTKNYVLTLQRQLPNLGGLTIHHMTLFKIDD